MKIVILNGESTNSKMEFSAYIENLCSELNSENEVKVHNLAGQNYLYCTGCWTCWWKNPGKCAISDGADNVFRDVINSDLVIFASPLKYGFTSVELKTITDRLIVLIHPYIELRHNESHHKKRYPKYPNIGLLVSKEDDTDNEDLQIIKDIYDRLAINFHCENKFLLVKEDHDIKMIKDEITNN